MSRFNNENMATAFQITAIIFIFSYTTPAVAKKATENNSSKKIHIKEIYQPVNTTQAHLQSKVYTSKTASSGSSRSAVSWVLPEMKVELNQDPAISTEQVVSPVLINYSAAKGMFR